MSRVKEYLALIPIVGSKYVYQRGVNGSFKKFFSEISKLSKPSSGTNDNTIHSERIQTAEWKLIACTEVNHMIEIWHVIVRIQSSVVEVTSDARWRQGIWYTSSPFCTRTTSGWRGYDKLSLRINSPQPILLDNWFVNQCRLLVVDT